MLARRLTTIAVLLLFSACGPETEVHSEPIAETPDPIADVAIDANPQESTPQRLDLSREGVGRVLEEMADADIELDSDRILPDMFDAEPEPEKMRVSGGVLTNEEAENLRDRIDGVELKIEFTRP